MEYSFRVEFSPDGMLMWKRTSLELQMEIASIQRRLNDLNDSSTNAARWFFLATLLKESGRLDAAATARTNAIKAFRREVEKRPQDAVLLTDLARALNRNGENEEAEVLFRRAAAMRPTSSERWARLGVFLTQRGLAELYDDPPHPIGSTMTSRDWMLKAVAPSAEGLQQAERRLREATECFEAALARSRTNASVYERRANLHRLDAVIRTVKQEAGKPRLSEVALKESSEKWIKAFTVPDDCLPDLRRAAELGPDDVRSIGAVALFQIVGEKLGAREKPGGKPPKDYCSEATVKSVRSIMERLQQVAESAPPSRASDAVEMLAILQLVFMQDPLEAQVSFRRSAKLNPKNEGAWDGLLAAIGAEKDHDKFLEASEARVKANPTLRAHLALAKAHGNLGQWDKSVADTQAAMRAARGQPLPELAYLSAVLRSGNSNLIQAALKSDAIKGLGQGGAKELGNDEKIHFMFITGLYLAYLDRVEEARDRLRKTLEIDPQHEGARQALELVQGW